jgi:hypothetical protein
VYWLALHAASNDRTTRPVPYLCLAKTPSGQKLNRSIDILTVKSYLDRPTPARWKAMKIQADGILARDKRGIVPPGTFAAHDVF